MNKSDIPIVTVMWTQIQHVSGSQFQPNHFVPLLQLSTEQSIPERINLTEDNHTLDNTPDIQTEDFSASFNGDDSTVPEEVHNIQHDQIDLSNIPDLTDSEEQIHDLANGSLGKTFLEVGEAVNVLQTFSSSDAHKHIPSGIKTDVYFVDNTENMRRRGKGNRSTFSDDGGIWNTSTGSTPKTYYMRTESGALKNIFRKNDQFCVAKKEKGKHKIHTS